MRFLDKESELFIEFPQKWRDILVVDTQNRSYKFEKMKSLPENTNDLYSVRLPKLKDNLVWGICVNRVLLPLEQRKPHHKYSIQLMLMISDTKRKTKKIVIKSTFYDLKNTAVIPSEHTPEYMLGKIEKTAVEICKSYVHITVDTEVMIKSDLVSIGEQKFIETTVSPDMESDSIARSIAELFAVFKDRHNKTIKESHAGKAIFPEAKIASTKDRSSESQKFAAFLQLIEVTQSFKLDDITYHRNFPLLAMIGTISDVTDESIAQNFANEYLKLSKESDAPIRLRLYETVENIDNMGFDISNFPSAKAIRDKDIEQIKKLEDFDKAVDALSS